MQKNNEMPFEATNATDNVQLVNQVGNKTMEEKIITINLAGIYENCTVDQLVERSEEFIEVAYDVLYDLIPIEQGEYIDSKIELLKSGLKNQIGSLIKDIFDEELQNMFK